MELVERAAAVLRANDRGRYTVPAGHLYPHQWAWDSAFAAIGWSVLDVDRALLELETLLDGAWPDGRVPHIRFHDPSGEYFPDPSFWGTVDRSSISQPPVWAAAARRVHDRGGDRPRLRALLGPMSRSHQWFLDARDPGGRGLVAVGHPWESGMDNSPSWDVAIAAVDPSDAPPFVRVDQQHVADPSERPTDDDYARFAALVAQIAANDFGLGSFAVYDPAMSAVLAWADDELAQLADALDEPDIAAAARQRCGRVTEALVTQLWDEAAGRFVVEDANTGVRHAPDVLSAGLPLLCRLPDPIADALRSGLEQRFDTPYGLPTVSPGDPSFDRVKYWRGPVWVNLNWLLDEPLGGRLRAPTLALIDGHGCHEYFDPISGGGLGVDDFTWTAAIALDWSTVS